MIQIYTFHRLEMWIPLVEMEVSDIIIKFKTHCHFSIFQFTRTNTIILLFFDGSTAGITYNINNGVQIVGAPPPYSQAAGTDGDNLQSINAAADLPPPYRAEDEVYS